MLFVLKIKECLPILNVHPKDIYRTDLLDGVTVTNINLDSSMVDDDNNFKMTVQLIDTYFRNGGAQI